MEKIQIVAIGIVLVIQTILDIRWKKIPLAVTAMGGIFGLVLMLYQKTAIHEILFSVFPGVCCLLFAKASRQAIGYGDAFLLCVMGLFYSMEEMMFLLMIAFGMAGAAALVLILIFRKKRKYEMAFVPFLLTAYGIDIWIRIGNGSL